MPGITAKVTPQQNGNYAVLIDGKVLGEISAHPKAAFVIPEGLDERGRPKATVLGSGTHLYNYGGRKLKIEVKDLALRFAPVDDAEFNRSQARKAGLPVEDYLVRVKAANDKARAEVLGRVVVAEAEPAK